MAELASSASRVGQNDVSQSQDPQESFLSKFSRMMTTTNSERGFTYGEARVTNFGDERMGCNMFTDCCSQPPIPSTARVDEAGKWQWKNGKLHLSCTRPIVHVPIVQEIQRRDKIIEVPQLEVIDAVQPKIYKQGVKHEVPKFRIEVKEKKVEMPVTKYVDREVIVPVVTGYTHKFVPKWEIREVPKPVVKYIGEQKIIEVEVPQVKFVDKIVEKEVVVDTVEKKVPKIIEEIKYIDTVKYVWKPVEKPVYIEKYVPKFDVSLECPAPLIVPYPVKTFKDAPAVMMRKEVTIPNAVGGEVDAPPGTVRVPEIYIRDNLIRSNKNNCSLLCATEVPKINELDENHNVDENHNGLRQISQNDKTPVPSAIPEFSQSEGSTPPVQPVVDAPASDAPEISENEF